MKSTTAHPGAALEGVLAAAAFDELPCSAAAHAEAPALGFLPGALPPDLANPIIQLLEAEQEPRGRELSGRTQKGRAA
ncbi:hypothetical protein [Streptomyces sp. NPDC001165]|uniref:hypothetical protein n=1 Tax=Streptomyces sp. NPDC001165 TaxID=3364546 RepID=UPI0036BD54AE